MSSSTISPPSSTLSTEHTGPAGADHVIPLPDLELKHEFVDIEHVELKEKLADVLPKTLLKAESSSSAQSDVDLVAKSQPQTQTPDSGDNDHHPSRDASVSGATVTADGPLKSRFDAMGVLDCLWLFRHSLLYTSIAFTGRMMQYFEVVMSTAVAASPGFAAEFGKDGVLDPKWVVAWTVGTSIGQMLPMPAIGYISDKWGRRPALLFAWVLTTAAMVCFSTARSPVVWLIGRLLTGGSTGVLGVVAAPYGVEICVARIRGIVLTSAILLGAFATLLATVLMHRLLEHGAGGPPLLAAENWRVAVYAMWGPVVAMLLCFLVIPESPWFLAHFGRHAASDHVLHRLYSGVPGYDYEEEYGIMVRTLEREHELVPIHDSYLWSDLFKGSNRKRTLVSAMLTASVQMGGYPLLATFGLSTFAQAGFSNPFSTTMVVSAVGCATVFAMMLLFDRYGRRLFVNTAYSLQGVAMLMWGCIGLAPSGASRTGGLTFVTVWWALTSALSNVQTIYLSEVPAEYLHIKTSALCSCVSGALDIGANFAVPKMQSALGLRSGFVFFSLAVPFAVFLWLYLPETMGRHASEIDELYDRDVPAWRWVRTRTYIEEEFAEAMRARYFDEGSVYDGATQRGDDADADTKAPSTRAPSRAASARGHKRTKSVAEQV